MFQKYGKFWSVLLGHFIKWSSINLLFLKKALLISVFAAQHFKFGKSFAMSIHGKLCAKFSLWKIMLILRGQFKKTNFPTLICWQEKLICEFFFTKVQQLKKYAYHLFKSYTSSINVVGTSQVGKFKLLINWKKILKKH